MNQQVTMNETIIREKIAVEEGFISRLTGAFSCIFLALSAMTGSAGCGDHFSGETILGSPPEDSDKDFLTGPVRNEPFGLVTAKEERCTRTGGTWHPNLMSCRCSSASLYHVKEGCAWDLDAAWQSEKEAKHFGGLEVHTRDSQVQRQDIVKALAGWEVPEQPFSRAELTIFLNPSKTWLQAVFGPDLASLFLGQKERKIALGAMEGMPLGEKGFEDKCHRLIDEVTFQKNAYRDICTEMALSLEKHVKQKLPTKWFYQDESGAGFVGGAWTAHLSGSGRTVLANMEVSDGVIYSRRFLGYRSNGKSIRLEIGPDGHLIGGYISEVRELLKGSGFLTASKTIIFNQNLEVVHVREGKSGSEEDFMKLSDHISGREVSRGAPESNITAPIGLIVAEHSVSLATPTVVKTLDFRSDIVSRPLTHPILGPISDPLSHLGMLSGASAGGHGTAVISAASRGIPNVKVNIIDISALDAFRDPGSFHLGANSLLQNDIYRVFNISLSFPRLTNDCRSIFGPVFERYKGQTLFVVAAEAFGGVNRVDGCPQGLSSAYSNVVVVAPTTDDGDLDLDYNHGDEQVDLAAPIRAEAIVKVNKDIKPPTEVWRPMSGSSASAALVSRLALKIFAARPNMTAPEVADMICQHRQKKNLQVRCGGEIDFEKIEKVIQVKGKQTSP